MASGSSSGYQEAEVGLLLEERRDEPLDGVKLILNFLDKRGVAEGICSGRSIIGTGPTSGPAVGTRLWFHKHLLCCWKSENGYQQTHVTTLFNPTVCGTNTKQIEGLGTLITV